MQLKSIMQNVSISTAGTALLTLGAIAPSVAASLYSITDLGTLNGTTGSGATSINQFGQVAGNTSSRNDFFHSFFWKDGVITDLGTLGGNLSVTWGGINNFGVVVGGSDTGVVEYNGFPVAHAFLWSKNQGMIDLTPNAGFLRTRAQDINDLGQVIITTDSHTAFLWQDGATTNLCLNANNRCDVYEINNREQVVGYMEANNSGSLFHAFRWENGQITDLGLSVPSINTSANAINEFGQIVGQLNLHAAFWKDDNNIIDLGTLGGRLSNAVGINNLGQVVGWSDTAASPRQVRPFLWDEINGLQDLNSLIPANSGWLLNVASDINDSGQIVGSGVFNGESRGFLLTPETEPIPEPTSALGVLGLGAIGAIFRLFRNPK